jgi:hypothetical protein
MDFGSESEEFEDYDELDDDDEDSAGLTVCIHVYLSFSL